MEVVVSIGGGGNGGGGGGGGGGVVVMCFEWEGFCYFGGRRSIKEFEKIRKKTEFEISCDIVSRGEFLKQF